MQHFLLIYPDAVICKDIFHLLPDLFPTFKNAAVYLFFFCEKILHTFLISILTDASFLHFKEKLFPDFLCFFLPLSSKHLYTLHPCLFSGQLFCFLHQFFRDMFCLFTRSDPCKIAAKSLFPHLHRL